MQKITKDVFVSYDGKEFTTAQECSQYEDSKFRKRYINFTTKELIELLITLHPIIVDSKMLPLNDDAIVTISVMQDIPTVHDINILESYTGIKFMINISESSSSNDNNTPYSQLLNGVIYGDMDFVLITKDNTVGDNNEYIKQNGFSLNSIAQLLDRIGFYSLYDNKIPQNPDITSEWVKIYEQILKPFSSATTTVMQQDIAPSVK